MFKKNIKIHFIGIGGIGMSGIAELLLRQGHHISGSDIANNANSERLKSLGAKIFIGHRAENIDDATVVVFSSAISPENPEILVAKSKKIPLIQRAEMLAELMRVKYGLAVAGTHGKTTTTSFLATLLHEAGMDPTHVIGGIVQNLGGNAQVGKGEFIVVEADESDGSFLFLNPVLSVITNIDTDHLDYYKTEEALFNAFLEFSNKIPFYGKCALNIHDKKLREVKGKMKRPSVTFGIQTAENLNPDYEAKNISHDESGTSFDLYFNQEFKIRMKINLFGTHNILNSLGAIALARELDISYEKILAGIKKFMGVQRRFQNLLVNDKLEIVDDYGHHPTEIKATVETLRSLKKEKIVVIFEPHRYTRTKLCWAEFLHCFNSADEVLIAPIYPASEAEIPGINTTKLVEDINKLHPGLAVAIPNLENLHQTIEAKLTHEKVIFLSMGAGSIGKRIRDAVKHFE